MSAERVPVCRLARTMALDAPTVVAIAGFIGVPVNGVFASVTEEQAALIRQEWARLCATEPLLVSLIYQGACQLAAAGEAIREMEQEVLALNGRRDRPRKGPFVASHRRRRFHRPQCEYAQVVMQSRDYQVFNTHEEAVSRGSQPCRSCCA